MASLNFNASSVPPTQSFEALPAGWYNTMIIGSEMRPTKDGQNQYLRLTLQVIDGQYANRQVFDNLNLQHSNPVASEIAYRKLSAYCHATGVMQVQDSQQLHGIPFKSRITVRPADGQYEASNDVKDVKHMQDPSAGGNGAPAQQPFQQQAQQPFQQPAQQQPAFQQQPAGQVVQQAPFQQQAPAQFQGAAPAAAQFNQQTTAPTMDNGGAQPATTSPSEPPFAQQQAPVQQGFQPQQPQQPAQQGQPGGVPPWAQ